MTGCGDYWGHMETWGVLRAGLAARESWSANGVDKGGIKEA